MVAYGNSFGMVKKNNIGKSATKHPQVDEGSTTIPNGSTPEANGGKGEQLQSWRYGLNFWEIRRLLSYYKEELKC